MWRTVLIIIMTAGFIILYLSYTAMLINYGTQCQLMIFLLLGLSERIEDANLELPDTAISVRFFTYLRNSNLRILSFD